MEKIDIKLSGDKSFFYGFRKAFIKNNELSLEARFILILLMTFKGKNRECWPSLNTLGKICNRNRDSIRRYIKELIFAGFLVSRSKGIGRSLLYAPSYIRISAGGQQNNCQNHKPAEETIHQPAESTLNRSISSENKDSTLKTGKELFDQRRKEFGI